MKSEKAKEDRKRHPSTGLWLGSLVVVVAVFVTGYILGGGGQDSRKNRYARSESAPVEGETPAQGLFACPMMCVPPMKKPGKCPVCGMDLIRVSGRSDQGEQGSPRLKLSSEAVRLAEIQTSPVEKKWVSADVRLYGRIDYDPAHMSNVTAFMPGVVDRIYVKRAGQFVRWGDPLFDIYSADLVQAQEQLIEAMKVVPTFLAFQAGSPHVAREVPVQPRKRMDRSGGVSEEEKEALRTINAIRRKLQILGMPKRDIDELMKVGEATGIATVYAPMYGQVIEQNAFEGAYVNTGTLLFKIADPHFVWLRLDAYESDYPWIRKGQQVAFEVDAYPGESFEGEVVYIDTVFDIPTRTFEIGVISPDQGGRFKAGMLVRAQIHARLTEEGSVANPGTADREPPLVIPASAPLVTGKRAVVYVSVPEEDGLFEGREVVLGPRARDHYVVLGGLREGEQVVVNGNFKIDSSLQILAQKSMMDVPGGHRALAHQYEGGSRGMHRDYRQEREKSRMGPESAFPPHPHETESWSRPAGSREGRSSIDDMETIRRRKPGSYGDTTRGK